MTVERVVRIRELPRLKAPGLSKEARRKDLKLSERWKADPRVQGYLAHKKQHPPRTLQ